MRALVIGLALAAAVGAAAALEALAQGLRRLPVEPRLTALEAAQRGARHVRPPALAQLETLAEKAYQGERTAAAQLGDRLRALGADAPPEPVWAELVEALDQLEAQRQLS
ncbi:MAG: hypothetical protein ACKVWR_13265 [Acidimicrobiales bacterium]